MLSRYIRTKNLKLLDVKLPANYLIGSSSITDSYLLPEFSYFCELAAQNRKIFENFRRSKVMITALDHVSFELGHEFLSEIFKYGEFEKYNDLLKKIDSQGNPIKYDYPVYGKFSPTLLRYLKIYLEIKYLFGDFSNLNIVEIGVGFGGQSAIINSLCEPKSYTFFDLPSVLNLSKVFLGGLNLDGKIKFINGLEPSNIKSDFVLSNYAFSELNQQYQQLYLEKVILNSGSGYMIWNDLSYKNLGGYSIPELIRIIPGSKTIPELPKTGTNNQVIIWGI